VEKNGRTVDEQWTHSGGIGNFHGESAVRPWFSRRPPQISPITVTFLNKRSGDVYTFALSFTGREFFHSGLSGRVNPKILALRRPVKQTQFNTFRTILRAMAKSIRHILKKTGTYKVAGSLWVEYEGERFFGPGPAELLEGIDKTGSINQAAKQMGMSYKKAWEMISRLNSQSGKPLVIQHAGGEKGGGSEITDEARDLIAFHRRLRERFTSFLEKETKTLKKP
jgi:molybdate transport system regulatory protein